MRHFVVVKRDIGRPSVIKGGGAVIEEDRVPACEGEYSAVGVLGFAYLLFLRYIHTVSILPGVLFFYRFNGLVVFKPYFVDKM